MDEVLGPASLSWPSLSDPVFPCLLGPNIHFPTHWAVSHHGKHSPNLSPLSCSVSSVHQDLEDLCRLLIRLTFQERERLTAAGAETQLVEGLLHMQ